MQFCDLPADVLYAVLRWHLGASRDAASRFKDGLPLLAVCRELRRLAVPVVYDCVLIRHASARADANDERCEASNDAPIKVTKITTNLDLVAAAGFIGQVKRADICITFWIDPLPGLRDAADMLRSVSSACKGIIALRVILDPTCSLMKRREIDATEYEVGAREAGKSLADTLPGLRRLQFGGRDSNPISRLFIGQLTSWYTESLEEVRSAHSMAIPQGLYYQQLRHVSLNCNDDKAHQSLPLNVDNLETLSLFHRHQDDPWAVFAASNGSRTIVFPKLRSLALAHHRGYVSPDSDEVEQTEPKWDLHFPALESMDVDCSQVAYSDVYGATLPPHMTNNQVMPARARGVFDAMSRPVAPRMRLSAYSGSGDDDDDDDDVNSGLAAACRMLDGALGCAIRELHIKYSNPLYPEEITCSTLTHLKISADTTIDTMLALIQMLPLLDELTLNECFLDDVDDDMSIPEPEDTELVEPLDTRIKRLAIHADPSRHHIDDYTPVAKYMLLMVPTLARFEMSWAPRQPVMDFIDAYSHRYPRLKSVQCFLYDKSAW